MNEMTLPSRHMIRNSNPGGLRPSTLPLGYGGSPQRPCINPAVTLCLVSAVRHSLAVLWLLVRSYPGSFLFV